MCYMAYKCTGGIRAHIEEVGDGIVVEKDESTIGRKMYSITLLAHWLEWQLLEFGRLRNLSFYLA